MTRTQRWIFVPAAAAVCLLALFTGGAFRVAAAAESVAWDGEPDPSPTASPAPLPQLVGFNLNLYHVADVTTVFAELDRVAELGCNAVQIVTPVFQPNGASDRPRLLQRPYRGPTDDDLLAVLRHARRLGLHVALMPQVNFTEPRGNEWRGKLMPDDWDAWWTGYREVTLHFAELANDAGIDVFVVGCELLTTLTSRHEERWRSLIADVRETFPGRLTFSTTWDSYERVRFWDALDFLGVSGYWDLTTQARDRDDPTPRELDRAWRPIRKALLAFAEEQGKPLLLTEVGYPSLPWALKDPWNYVADDAVEADAAAQTAGYRALLRAWSGLVPAPPGAGEPDPIAGLLFYEWSVYSKGGPFDRGYTVQGKPAEAVLRRYFSGQAWE